MKPSASWPHFLLHLSLPFLWHPESQAGNIGKVPGGGGGEGSEPGFIPRNVINAIIFSSMRCNSHSEMSIYENRIDLGNVDDESLYT